MPGRILVIDPVATNRIVRKVNLAAACYEVLPAATVAEGEVWAAKLPPDVILIGIANGASVPNLERLLKLSKTSKAPLVVLSDDLDRDTRVDLLAAGVEDVLTNSESDAYLLARIRSLLRARDAAEEIRLRDSTTRGLGFAEKRDDFELPTRVTLVGGNEADTETWKAALEKHFAGQIETRQASDILIKIGETSISDAIVLVEGHHFSRREILALLPEFRSRAASRHAAIITVLNSAPTSHSVMALDLGASDVVCGGFHGREMAQRLGTQIRKKRDADRLRETVRDGLKLAVTDPLTGLYNRRYAMPHLGQVIESAKSSGRSFAVMIADLDRFKSVNDSYGHAAGDAVLVEVARRLCDNLRGVDMVARIGGEEFLIAMPDTSQDEALAAAERLCRVMKATPVDLSDRGQKIPVTLSIGIAIGGPGTDRDITAEILLERADIALYASKSEGRDQVTLSRSAA